MERSKYESAQRHSIALTSRRCGGLVLLCAFLLVSSAAAQDNPAPPPIKVVPRAEKERLDAKTDIKDRTKLSLDLMSEHLAAAEKLLTTEDFEGIVREFGFFHGLIDDCLDFLQRRSNTGKALDNLKRFEMGLRTFTSRLETVRRELPSRYEEYVSELMKAVRDARSRATEPMFSNSVVPNIKPGIDQ